MCLFLHNWEFGKLDKDGNWYWVSTFEMPCKVAKHCMSCGKIEIRYWGTKEEIRKMKWK